MKNKQSENYDACRRPDEQPPVRSLFDVIKSLKSSKYRGAMIIDFSGPRLDVTFESATVADCFLVREIVGRKIPEACLDPVGPKAEDVGPMNSSLDSKATQDDPSSDSAAAECALIESVERRLANGPESREGADSMGSKEEINK